MEKFRIKVSTLPEKVKTRRHILKGKTPFGRPVPVITGMGGVLRNLENKNSDKIQELTDVVSNQGQAIANELIKQRIKTGSDFEYVQKQNQGVYSIVENHLGAINPHGITKETIGLNRVENTSDIEKPVSIPVQIALNTKANKEDLIAIENKIEESIKGQEKIKKDLSSSMNIIGGVGGESLVGGKKGQVLKKVSNKDGDYTWQDESASKTHNELEGRDVDNCHPISAITNLQTELNGKQPTISDLDEIRSGASAGSTALQPSALNGYATETWVGQQGYLTGITSSDVTTALGYTPYNSSNPSGYISGITSAMVTTALGYTPQQQLESGTNIKTINNNSILGSGNLALDGLPSQTGNAGKFLTTDGTDASWGVPKTHNLFDFIWRDAELNDMAWLRADTFSWQDGTVYTNAYNHLVADISGKTATSETVGSYTISYYLADDGHKITTDETNVLNIYNESGVAWYYILDQSNQRFKLPRENPSKEILGTTATTSVYGNGTALGIADYNNMAGNIYLFSSQGDGSSGITRTVYYAGDTTSRPLSDQPVATGSNPADHRYLGVHTDPAKSGLTGTTYLSSQNGIYKGKQYLYFYVGQFSQSATEQTAGLNAELFNGKLDLDLGNITNVSKKTIVGWGMPGIVYEDLTAVNETTYTAPANGYFAARVTGSSQHHFFMNVEENGIGNSIKDPNPSSIWKDVSCPVLKGQSIRINFVCDVQMFRFVYAQGEV